MNTTAPALTAIRTFRAPELSDPNTRITITATTDRGHFSVTASAYNGPRETDRNWILGGCCHEEAAHYWPAIRPIVALHLSDALTGEPMHAEANGWHWLAGALGGLGEEYHGGSGSDARTPDQCLAILADHLRTSPEETAAIVAHVNSVYNAPIPEGEPRTSKQLARQAFAAHVLAQRPRWAAEAEAGIALIRSLSTPAA